MTVEKPCRECGMLCTLGEYHPYAACLLFRGCQHGGDVRVAIESIQQAERERILKVFTEIQKNGVETGHHERYHAGFQRALFKIKQAIEGGQP